jgi:hypothetical protein
MQEHYVRAAFRLKEFNCDLKKQRIAFTFGLSGLAFAESTDPSLLGNDEFQFNAPETKAGRAARGFDYDQESLAIVGTEAGDWEYRHEPSDNQLGAAVANETEAVPVCSDC